MIRRQVYVTSSQQDKLFLISQELGTPQSVLIREAIDQFIEHKLLKKKKKQSVLQAAFGLWADRDDLPDCAKSQEGLDRVEFDRP